MRHPPPAAPPLPPGEDGFVEFGSIHTAACLDAALIDPEVGAFPGDADGGCTCEGIPTFIRWRDLPRAPKDLR